MDYYSQLNSMLSKWLGKYGKIVGHNILSPEYQITIITVIVRFSLIYLATSSIYLMINGDAETAVKALGVIGINVQVIIVIANVNKCTSTLNSN